MAQLRRTPAGSHGKPGFLPDVGVAHGVELSPVLGKLPQGGDPGLGEPPHRPPLNVHPDPDKLMLDQACMAAGTLG